MENYHCMINRLTCKKKQGDFNFALESREGDFSWYRARISPTSPGLVSPEISIVCRDFPVNNWFGYGKNSSNIRDNKGTKSGQYDTKSNKNRSESKCPGRGKQVFLRDKRDQQHFFFYFTRGLFVCYFPWNSSEKSCLKIFQQICICYRSYDLKNMRWQRMTDTHFFLYFLWSSFLVD